MLNKEKLQKIIEKYMSDIDSRRNEFFKWRAVKCFQDHWNIEADDLGKMLKESLSQTSSLLTSNHAFPLRMILNFAKADPEATRKMFSDLYDESVDLSGRIASFMERSEKLRVEYGKGEWKSHFQNVNAVSTYLWLRFPDKYYIYKYSVSRTVGQRLDPNFKKEAKGAVEGLIYAYSLYDQIREELKRNDKLKGLYKRFLTENDYPDYELCTATTDIAFYIAKYMGEESVGDGEMNSMKASDILELLKKEPELIPDKHDGSYELMRRTIEEYSQIDDYSVLDYSDLDLIYMMAIITTSDGVEKKKERVLANQHLNLEQKNRLLDTLDRIWGNACQNKYSNDETIAKYSIGMFGTAFRTFNKINPDESWNRQTQEFIRMLVDINRLKEDDEIFDRAEPVLKHPYKGLRAGSVSVILHCLKPYTFPIINGNEKMGDLFDDLGIPLKQKHLSETYISNCRNIKQFRDTYLPFKNYRIFDLVARRIKSPSVLFPSLDEYREILSKEQWIDFLQEDRKKYPRTLKMLKKMYEMGGEATCAQLAEELGESPTAYISRGSALGVRVKRKYGISDFYDSNGDKWDFIVPFQGHGISANGGKKQYSWVLRTELKDAIEEIINMDEPGEIQKPEKVNYDHNIILYGPPGTGKTYHTAIYAVAICDGLTFEEVEVKEYADILERYKELKEERRIAFTTFHQSYGYEEFIEGIRPVLENEVENGEDIQSDKMEYKIKAGVFKEFCDKAHVVTSEEEDEEWNLNEMPAVWKVSLEKAGDNETRKECMENGHIRIGWDEYGEDYTKIGDYYSGGKVVLKAFYDKMRKGDLVISCYNSEEIDAIGIISGEAEWDDSYRNYKRVRKVDWIAKGLRENILNLNDGKVLTLATIYKTDISAESVLNIVRRKQNRKVDAIEKKNYVFIIDEINRGNISKIMGELITLIEESKRIGAKEEMQVTLPYSGKQFGVPDNVYIIGTMNTADRSIALMDTALRRRFQFREMMPEPDILRSIEIEANGYKLSLSQMLEVMNKRIECLYDREHTIGHAFFTNLLDEEENVVDKLADIFKKSVIPLLQEYFYEDYDKIRLVLGDNAKDEEIQFIKKIRNESHVFRGNTSDIDYSEDHYEINEDAFKDIRSYIEIIESTKEK